MGSLPEKVNLLEYLRSRSQVDCDSLDIQLATELGPFGDCTSNQADAYTELLNPQRTALLKKSATLAKQAHSDFAKVSCEELAVEIAMVSLSLTLVPLITGDIHVMANPTLQTTAEIVENAQRISKICTRLQPSFDQSRLCIKVVSTWEGMQACRKLTSLGIRTLATTLFTFEQAILAAEAGCVYIAPFVHELKAFFDASYHDGEPILPLCVKIQRYYEQHSYATRVKAAGLLSVDEAMKLAGVASLTIAPDLLRTLSTTEEQESELVDRSLFVERTKIQGQETEYKTFIDDETEYRRAFAESQDGKGQVKTAQAIGIFSEYQIKAEAMMRDPDLTRIG